MSILTDVDIEARIASKDIVIVPFVKERLGTNSYDITLARRLLVYMDYEQPLDCKRERATRELIIPDEGLLLKPGELYLGVTVEYTETHDCVPFLEGKSSLGRLGLSMHITAGRGDVGFCGHWTMEITAVRPVRVYAGMPVGVLIYHTVSSPPRVSYASKPSQKYSAQFTASIDPRPVASRMYRNFPDGVALPAFTPGSRELRVMEAIEQRADIPVMPIPGDGMTRE